MSHPTGLCLNVIREVLLVRQMVHFSELTNVFTVGNCVSEDLQKYILPQLLLSFTACNLDLCVWGGGGGGCGCGCV